MPEIHQTTTQRMEHALDRDEPLTAVPLSARQHWMTPTMIYAGLEFCIPVLMAGSLLAGSFDIWTTFWILAIGLLFLTWAGDSVQAYMGAKTGLSASVIARGSFGALQARMVGASTIFLATIGWGAIQTSVAANAISVILGIDYETQRLPWAAVTIVVGLLFAVPAVLGYTSMKWTDYVAVPAGILLIGTGIFYSFEKIGWERISSWSPPSNLGFLEGVSLVIGLNVSQWVITSDYSRYAHPRLKDSLLIPMGIVAVGFPLIIVGSFMSVGMGTADIVQVMLSLGFPVWGFLILWFATWTSMLVNVYTMGLALSNLMNVRSGRGRAVLTFGGNLISIGVALAGILHYFTDFLYLTALFYPALAGVMFFDYFFLRQQQWKDLPGWNWMATAALVLGIGSGYYSQYVTRFGIPAVQTVLLSGAVYYALMRVKAVMAPDSFTPDTLRAEGKSRRVSEAQGEDG